MKNILIVDDETKLRNLLSRIISYEGFNVFEAENCRTVHKILGNSDIDVVLCDVRLPDGNGIELAHQIRSQYPAIEVILLTAYGNIPDSVQAIKNGAFDYITKGDDNNKIVPLIYRAIEKIELSKRILNLEKQVKKKYSFDNIIGQSKKILEATEIAKKVAVNDTTVLLTGETGTGKEIFAMAIHQLSSRRNKNFVAINCSAFSHELLESEFFGYRAGAFTGATRNHKGLFEEAGNGSIFLDEIGDLANDLQAKLLRVIETGEFLKVGDNKPTKVDVRIIAATNKNLPAEVENGNFRADLYYRLSVFQITLPPLRERVADIEPFAQYFMKMFAAKANKKITSMSEDFIKALKLHSWKGNIRELRNIMERSVILSSEPTLTLKLLPPEIQNNQLLTRKDYLHSGLTLAETEKFHILKVLELTRGNKTKTAELLGIALTTLYRKLTEYGLN